MRDRTIYKRDEWNEAQRKEDILLVPGATNIHSFGVHFVECGSRDRTVHETHEGGTFPTMDSDPPVAFKKFPSQRCMLSPTGQFNLKVYLLCTKKLYSPM